MAASPGGSAGRPTRKAGQVVRAVGQQRADPGDAGRAECALAVTQDRGEVDVAGDGGGEHRQRRGDERRPHRHAPDRRDTGQDGEDDDHGGHHHPRLDPRGPAGGEADDQDEEDRGAEPQGPPVGRVRLARRARCQRGGPEGPAPRAVPHHHRDQGRQTQGGEELARGSVLGEDQVRQVRHGKGRRGEAREQRGLERHRHRVEPGSPGDPHRERRQQDDRRVEVEQRDDHRTDDPQAPDEVPRRATPRHCVEHVELVEQRGAAAPRATGRRGDRAAAAARRPRRARRSGRRRRPGARTRTGETTPAPRGGG